MAPTDYGTLIAQLGFPIVVCGYLLIRMETTIKALTDTVAKNTLVIAQLVTKEGGTPSA